MHYGYDPFAMEGKKNTSNEKEYQESLLAQQNGNHFSKKSIQATFSGQKVKKQPIQRTDEAKETSKGTMPEQCLIAMNFLYVKKKKMAQNRFHNITIHVIVVKSHQLFDTPEKLQQQF